MVVSSSAPPDGRSGPPARAAAPSHYGSITGHISQADRDENRPPSSRSGRSYNRRAALALSATLGVASLFFVRLRTSSSSHGGGANGLKKPAAGGRPATLSNSILGGTWWGLTEDVLGDSADAFSDAPSSADASSSSDDNDEAICEYVSTRKVKGIQTSKSEIGKQWSEIACREHSGEDGDDVIAPGDNAAMILIDLPAAGDKGKDVPPSKKNSGSQIFGFGGSITEATTLNWKSLNPVARDAVIELLYGDTGLGYTLGRVPIGSSDFSVSPYNFENNEDLSLESFDRTVSRDYENGMIDMIKSARYVTEHSWEEGAGLRLVASPWSPPAWMKQPLPTDPFDASHAGTMEQTVLPECLRDGVGADSKYAAAWARYIGAFISAYQEREIDFWAVTVQNEPLEMPKYEACAHDKSSEKEFVVHHLGPVLRQDHPEVKIFAYDANKDQCVDFMEHFWSADGTNDLSLQYIDGVALHWYSRSHSDLDGGEGAPNMHRLKELASTQGHLVPVVATANDNGSQKRRSLGKAGGDKAADGTTLKAKKQQQKWEEPILLDTEATHCKSTGYAENDPDLSWHRAERNAHAILSQLAAGSNGFIELNMVLDPLGGPNHAEKFCDAPLIAVPHRAEDVTDFDFVEPVPAFEKYQLQNGESIKSEYETKFSLSERMGYSMSLMNLGIVAQPMFYYVGHISRYVRPGSRPLRAIVGEGAGGVSSRTFRPAGNVEPGGGHNNLAREGTEVTFWPCEGSTRQSWSFNKGGEIHVAQHNHKKSSDECFSLSEAADPDLGGILLTSCGSSDVGLFDMIPVETTEGGGENLTKFSALKTPGSCLGIRKLANNGGSYGPRGGSQASLVSCDDPSALWSFSPETGEISSAMFSEGEVCLTTGWPFLQAGAFDTSEVHQGEGKGHKSGVTLVVLNESKDNASFLVKSRGSGNDIGSSPLLRASIPAHSIQTYIIH